MRAPVVALGLCLLTSAWPALAVERATPETAQPDAASQAPAAAPIIAPQAIAESAPAARAVRARLSEKRLDATAEERKAVADFYDALAGAPFFAGPDGLTALARAVLAELALADDYGLPAAELVPAKLAMDAKSLSEPEIADTEVRVSLAVLKYARYARGGRIPEPARQLATYLDRTPQLIEPKTVLQSVAAASDVVATLRGFNPQQLSFEALRKAYNEARKTKAVTEIGPDFPDGVSIRPGQRDAQIARARQILKVEAAAAADGKPADPTLHDAPMVAAIKAFQSANGLEPADGIIGNKTRAVLNSLQPPSTRKLLANMEQWRWMPADLGATNITVNIPEFAIRMSENNVVVHTERVVTGLVTNQTPIFSDALQTVVLQPDWVLPLSIKVNEALPSLLRGGGMFYSSGLKVKRGETDVDPHGVNWTANNIKNYTFYQPPGETNALGQVKFLFPNKHAVYMHDTPAKQLFDSPVRAFSHGCMRVRNPVRLAELVLAHDKGWDTEKVKQLIEDGPEDNKIPLDAKIPVHVTYFTAAPGEDGKIKSFRDIYGHEERISLALEGRWGDIDIPPDHLAPIEDREFEFRSAAVERRQRYEDERPYKGGKNDFEQALKSLFGGN